MDDIVLAAMQKWPNVPDCYGWLGLDMRGDWYMRDEKTQSAGGFSAACVSAAFAGAKGSRLVHEGLIAFIGRNYTSDATGRWYFQNGPQRVFVELACSPWVWRIEPSGSVFSHNSQRPNKVLETLVDELGRLYLFTELGLGLVHTQDMDVAADHVASGRWVPQNVQLADLPRRFGFVLSPADMAASQ